MLIDGVELPVGAEIKKTVPGNKGTTLPGSGTEGDYFELTAQDGQNAPGIYVRRSSAWVNTGSTNNASYDLALTITGKPDNAAKVMRFAAVRRFSLPASFLNSVAKAGVAATASAVFTIKRINLASETSTEGTITFSAAGTNGTFAQQTSGEMIFDKGEVLLIENQATADATLADISITLTGSLI